MRCLKAGEAIEAEVSFTNLSVYNVDEDFFLIELGRQTLPLASQVQRLHDFKRRTEASHPKRIGLYQPVIWSFDTLLRALAYHGRLKVILSLCDPVDRFERRMYGQHLPKEDTALREAYFSQLTDDNSVNLLRKWKAWQDTFEEKRLLIVEKTQLSLPSTFTKLTDFLEIRRYPKASRFHRYNSKGTRSALCKHRDLIEDLKKRFSPEYDFLREVVSTEEIHQRRTHCERSSLYQGRCQKERCVDQWGQLMIQWFLWFGVFSLIWPQKLKLEQRS